MNGVCVCGGGGGGGGALNHLPLLFCNNGLLTGCEGHTEKYRTAVFVQPELARAVLKDQGSVFLSMARANPVNKPFII